MRAVLYRLVHYLLWLAELFYQQLVSCLMSNKTPGPAVALQLLTNDKKSLSKLPSHVGILLVENEFSFKDLANMIVWSVTLGVSYISVYDINGEVKRNSLLLQQNINTSKKEVVGSDASSYDIQILSSSHPVVQSPPAGTSKTYQANVHLLCVEDGHTKIVDIARHFSQMVCQGMYFIEDIRPSNVDTVFQESMQFPDPDLCLKFGSVDSLFGYLPWQIRLTEIISLPTHKGLTYKSFLSSLIQYGNTDKRFGK